MATSDQPFEPGDGVSRPSADKLVDLYMHQNAHFWRQILTAGTIQAAALFCWWSTRGLSFLPELSLVAAILSQVALFLVMHRVRQHLDLYRASVPMPSLPEKERPYSATGIVVLVPMFMAALLGLVLAGYWNFDAWRPAFLP